MASPVINHLNSNRTTNENLIENLKIILSEILEITMNTLRQILPLRDRLILLMHKSNPAIKNTEVLNACYGRRLFSVSTAKKESFNIQDSDDFEKRVLQSATPVVVDFHAKWCGPCKILGPRLETLVQSKKGKVYMAKVDIDEHSELAMEYEVSAVPSVIAIKGGQVTDRFMGVIDDDKINSFLDKLIGPT